MSIYSGIIIITELLMITMLFHVVFYSGLVREQKSWYIATFVTVMVCAFCEYCVHCGWYDNKFRIILTVITVIQFSLAPLLGVFFTGALGLHQRAKQSVICIYLSTIVEAAGALFKWTFYFDEYGYHRGPYFIIYGVLFTASIIYLIYGIVTVGKKFKHRDSGTIIMIIVIIIAGVIPMVLFKINITYIAIATSAIICYVYYNDLIQEDIQYELLDNQNKISNMQIHIISGMASLIENRDTDTGEHISRTSAYVKTLSELAKEEGIYTDQIDDHFITLIYTLAPMHDIGKILVPDEILKKPGKLTDAEFKIMKKHASGGGTVIREILTGITDDEYMAFASDIATYHHEWWNGNGYPYNIRGEEIPLSARIMAIADVFDALVSERCYKKAMPYAEAFKIIQNEAGTHFDPKLVEVFIKHKDKFRITINGNIVV